MKMYHPKKVTTRRRPAPACCNVRADECPAATAKKDAERQATADTVSHKLDHGLATGKEYSQQGTRSRKIPKKTTLVRMLATMNTKQRIAIATKKNEKVL